MSLIRNFKHRWDQLIPPVKWMIYLFTSILALSLIFAPTPSPSDYFQSDYSYTTSSKVYFNNVRSYYYTRMDEKAAGFHRFELKKQQMHADDWPLLLSLMDNWRNDELYVHVDLDSTMIALEIDTATYKCEAFNREAMHRIAASLYLAVKNDKTIRAVYNDKSKVIFEDSKDRKVLETTLFDYFRWLDIH